MIDRRYGDGYAEKHPELVGHFMQTAASIYATSVHARLMDELDATLMAVHGH